MSRFNMSKEQTDWVLVPRDGLEKLVRLYEEDFDDASEHRPDWLRQALYAPASTSTAEAEPVAWQVMLPSGHEGSIFRIEEQAQAVAAGFKTAFARPLYAHPSPSGDGERVTDERVKRAATEFLSHKGERPWRVTKCGAELWEDYAPAMRAALTAALATPLTEGGERNAVIEECAKVADRFGCGVCGMDGKAGEAIRALKSGVQSDA